MSFTWSARATQALSATALSALLLASAMKHFRSPSFFYPVVPDYLCRNDDADADAAETAGASGTALAAAAPRNGPLAIMSREEWIAATGLLEAAAAVGLLIPATRKAAAAGTAAMFTTFLAGHIDALRRAYGPDGTPAERRVHTLRLPLQLPLVLWAWRLRK
ncbi:hypothetical protein [Arthrobacter sp. CJ23]|uniref:hypothetical protein n=1 Tax=Arthrobacter sp. CJ23 TaxID=2972479 RepID=UPI00215D57CE|nr:hypothetical protein [Arthrobacter sp. CJ23]UVJ39924.1 hypothetical protein NVV90_01630 [Arthrobacter sp. CJ23]